MHRFEALQRTLKLSNGHSMPMIGVGTWKLQNGQVGPVLEKAIEMGCRHIDCSPIYENEKDVGQTLSKVLNNYDQFKVKRKDVHMSHTIGNISNKKYYSCLSLQSFGIQDTPISMH